MSDKKKIKLILHVGAGKTGTTSIQNMLNNGKGQLKTLGVQYLGLMLEHAPKHFSWQRPTTVNQDFHALAHTDAVAQVVVALKAAIQQAEISGIHTLIWSNESLFDRNGQVLDALSQLQDALDVTILVYIRRHDSWAQSAYIQWGLKHKTYKGPMKSFNEWVDSGLPKFHDRLTALINARVGTLVMRNLDGITDSVEDFKSVCGLTSLDLPSARVNESVGSIELLLRTLFNSQFKSPVLPVAFDRVIGHLAYADNPDSFLKKFVPSADDLQRVRQLATEDRQKLDDLLRENGQPPLADSDITVTRREVDLSQLCLVLAQCLMNQAVKVERLSIGLKKLEEQLNGSVREEG